MLCNMVHQPLRQYQTYTIGANFHTGFDLKSQEFHVFFGSPVMSAMLVPKAQCMHQFMHNNSFKKIKAKVDHEINIRMKSFHLELIFVGQRTSFNSNNKTFEKQ